ncbi:MAG: hypothetical protein J7559_23555, partial [Cohnella sp.]|nr:hypothetical protein [Cohnella sp.]
KIIVTVAEPTEQTRRAVAQYLIDSMQENAEDGANFDPVSIGVSDMVIVLDAETKLVQSISMDQSAKLQDGDKNDTTVDQKLTVSYDYGGEARINLPDDLRDVLG